MRRRRGVTDSTLDTYQRTLIDLMRTLGDGPQAYTALAIRTFVLERARRHGKASAKVTVTAIRAFLRYLTVVGRCPAGREYAVPSVAGWQLAATPAVLDAQEIERVIAACDGEKRLRDRAVVLLLARLGLRASEVANLEFGHIDWKTGRLAVVGKSRRTEWLPLPQEVGEALIAYIERARPKVATPRVLITAQTPRQPINRVVVNDIVQFALERAGIESARKGSHLLRHSAATAMLRHGVSLAGVGAMLRHRSLRMTLHYAKVDFTSLAAVAQPWPGRPAC
jgi:site-specific recombinase XerD